MKEKIDCLTQQETPKRREKEKKARKHKYQYYQYQEFFFKVQILQTLNTRQKQRQPYVNTFENAGNKFLKKHVTKHRQKIENVNSNYL